MPLFNHHSHLHPTNESIHVQSIFRRLSSVLATKKARWTSGSLALVAGTILWSSWFLVQSNIGKRYSLQYSSTAIMMFFGAPNCIILAVSPANQDLATSDSIKISREVDPKEWISPDLEDFFFWDLLLLWFEFKSEYLDIASVVCNANNYLEGPQAGYAVIIQISCNNLNSSTAVIADETGSETATLFDTATYSLLQQECKTLVVDEPDSIAKETAADIPQTQSLQLQYHQRAPLRSEDSPQAECTGNAKDIIW
ncbi:hypothetical protein L1987_34710 [Smallanthus sonchifolius]|uniref:Uncharacterized protein n=1 Tax=Smallanthus sonchifolius TaxID=185202 RepID=A0ACB9HUZ8_9ASTR|nr:hypothetical protein L1987_34710 [Smallanthus sonchifolius]